MPSETDSRGKERIEKAKQNAAKATDATKGVLYVVAAGAVLIFGTVFGVLPFFLGFLVELLGQISLGVGAGLVFLGMWFRQSSDTTKERAQWGVVTILGIAAAFWWLLR